MIKLIIGIVILILMMLGYIITNRYLMKPVKIEFTISPFQIFLYGFIVFFCISMLMVVELLFCDLVQNYVSSQNSILNILVSLINNGLIIAVSLPIMSKFFGKCAKDINLDLCGAYSAKFVKIYYSLSIVANCILLLILHDKTLYEGIDNNMILNRVIVWVISVLGTWWGIGYRCEGRVYEELANIINSKSQGGKNKKQIIIPMGLAFVLNCIVLIIWQLNSRMASHLFICVYTGIFLVIMGALVSVFRYNKKYFTNKKKSKKKLSRAIRKLNDCSFISARYENVSYILERVEDKNFIQIQGREVTWDGHENEVEKLYGKMEKIEFSKNEDCEELLEQMGEKRRNFMRDARLKCDKELMNFLIKEKRKLIE